MSWPTTPDGQYYLFTGRVLIPVDPSTGVAQLMLQPRGGMGVGIPPIADGATGATPSLSSIINYTELAWNDPTASGASWSEISPDTYQLTLSLHGGEPGDVTAGAILESTDLTGSPVAKYMFQVNSGATGVEIVAQKVGDRYVPATINSIAAGNANATLCSVSIPSQPFDWRPDVSGWCLITGTGTDMQVDVVARLGTEASGNIVGRGTSRAGQTPPMHSLIAGPPAGSNDSYDKVAAGTGVTVYFRAERQSGASTYTTSSTTTAFQVRVAPVP